MLTLSKADFGIIGFLVRNISRRHTINELASKVGVSAAGAHAALKKLEKQGIVKGEKLGTGIFYELNFENKIAWHLASISLLGQFTLPQITTSSLTRDCKAALFDGKNLLVITSEPDKVKNIAFKEFSQYVLHCADESELGELLGKKDQAVVGILSKANALFGEEIILGLLSRR